MSKYQITEIEQKQIWEKFLLSRNPRSFLQSWNWGDTNILTGNKIFRVGIYIKSELVGVCLVIKENAKRGSHFLIPAGPLIDWNDKNLIKDLFNYIKDLAKQEKVWFIRIRPELLDSQNSRKLFKNLGFIPAPMHLHAENTWVLNLDKSDAEILKGIRKTTRYLVRKSLKTNLTLEVTRDIKKVKILKKLQDETVGRLKFVGFSEKLFEAQLETFGADKEALLFICLKRKVPLVASIVIFYGKSAYYHHSASSNKFRELPSSYFVQWNIIKEAQKRGCKYYDMWGSVPKGRAGHRFSGPSLFKEGFGADRVDWLHAQDLPVSPFYWITFVFETLRRKLRRL